MGTDDLTGSEATTRVSVVVHMNHDYGRRLLVGVSRYGMELGWHIAPVNALMQEEHLAKLSVHSTHGIVAYIDSLHVLRKLQATGVPVVAAYCSAPGSRFPYVLPDYRLAGRQVAEHFVENGLAHFAFVGQRRLVEDGPCLQGFRVGLRKGRRRVRIHTHDRTDSDQGDWLAALPKPCGLLTSRDSAGLQVMKRAQQAGVRVGYDLAVASVGNDVVWCCARNTPALSSVDFPVEAIGYEAGAMLNLHMTGKPVTSRWVAPTGLVPRASSDMLHVKDEMVADMLRYVRRHFAGTLELSDVAEHFAVSKRTLQRRFKEAVGHSFWDELMHCRLKHAERLLRTTDSPVKVVAFQSGFNAVEFFMRRFKAWAGCTPSQFRKQRSQPDLD